MINAKNGLLTWNNPSNSFAPSLSLGFLVKLFEELGEPLEEGCMVVSVDSTALLPSFFLF